jgi:hypothetical protein
MVPNSDISHAHSSTSSAPGEQNRQQAEHSGSRELANATTVLPGHCRFLLFLRNRCGARWTHARGLDDDLTIFRPDVVWRLGRF